MSTTFQGGNATTRPPTVQLAYWFEGARHQLSIGQSADGRSTPEELPWEALEREGQALRFCDQYGQRLLALERYGTHVFVNSDLDRETLIEIALSLQPAPDEPPRLVDA